MQICGQQFSPALVQRLQETLDREPGLSRTALSRRVCGWLDWRAPNGRWKEMSCRVALAKLERAGMLRGRAREAFPRPAAASAASPDAVAQSRRGAPLGGVAAGGGGAGGQRREPRGANLERAPEPLSSARCRAFVRGADALCPRSRRGEWLGGLAFSAAAWRVAARDRWIGWSEAARREHLPRVIANSRFLLLPGLRVPHLASHVLGQALRRVGRDWQERYGYAPYLVETFVEAGAGGNVLSGRQLDRSGADGGARSSGPGACSGAKR